MPRRKLKFAQGNYYHIYNRGANRMSIFRNDDNYRLALQLMKKYCVKFNVTVIAYCLMPNHYHWLLRPDSDLPAGLLPQRSGDHRMPFPLRAAAASCSQSGPELR